MESVEEVRSHPMALLQCMDFWSVRIIAVSDSWRRKIPLLSARRLVETGRQRDAAAIAGSLAAELFGLEIIAPDIHTVKNNYTRFLILPACRGGR